MSKTYKNKQRIADYKEPEERKEIVKNRSQAGRGMSFESRIETTNRFYLEHGLAVIQKIPTPTKNINGRIEYSEKSTVDYIGIENNGQGIAFEAKETTGRNGKPETSFPLMVHGKDMVKRHQRDFLKRWEEMDGYAFVLINFRNRGECYAVPVDFIEQAYENMEKGGRKSIPIDEFKEFWKVNVDDYLHLQRLKRKTGIFE